MRARGLRCGQVTRVALSALLPLLLGCAAAGWRAADEATALEQCINSGYEPQPTTLSDFEHAVPKRLWLQAQWRTRLPRSANLTVVTTASAGRLHQLQAQCASWGGPLVAAIWVPLLRVDGAWRALTEHGLQHADTVMHTLQEFHLRVEAEGACQLMLLLLHEPVEEELLGALMPINTLRNYALLAATTPLVAMVDVDLLLSASLRQDMAQPERYAALLELTLRRAVVVLPAFETRRTHELLAGQALAEHAVKLTKRQLRLGPVASGDVYWFQQYDYRWGHASTNYYEWFKDSTREPYYARAGNGYEPWFVINRHLNPFYDQRFRGYGNDKISHVLALNASGFDFWIHPHAFLVHRPHPKSAAYWTYVTKPTAPQEVSRRVMHGDAQDALALPTTAAAAAGAVPEGMGYDLKHITGDMWEQLKPQILSGAAEPLIDAAIRQCAQTLPWWGLGAGPSGVGDAEAAEAAARAPRSAAGSGAPLAAAAAIGDAAPVAGTTGDAVLAALEGGMAAAAKYDTSMEGDR